MTGSTEAITPPASLVGLIGRDHGSIGEVFCARAAQSPSHPFLFWGEQSWTYAQALDEVVALGSWFLSNTDAERPRIATYLPNCPQAMWAWLAAACAGRVLVPINRKHRGGLLADMLVRSQAGILITEVAALADLEPALGPEFRTLVLIDEPSNAATSLPVDWRPFADLRGRGDIGAMTTSASDIACVMYTSGTTGRSKAVMVLHNQYVRGAARLVDSYQLCANDVFHNWLPLYHLGGQLHMTMTAIICGGAVALQPAFSTSRLWQEIRSRNCSVLCGFATILQFIWSLPAHPDDMSSPLRVGIFAGIPPELLRPFECRFGMQLAENYGMTEIDPITCPQPDIQPPEGSCGRANPDVELAILGPDDQLMPPGELGEIAVRPRAPNVLMGGYEGDADATLASCRNLWFHTGDYGVLDEQGFLFFRGRASHYIRRRGENVSTAELEDIMLRHPSIGECAAVGVPSEVGEEDIKLVVGLRDGESVRPQDLLAYATANMATFMVPRYIEFVSQLPRSELGKVKISDLRVRTAATWDALAR